MHGRTKPFYALCNIPSFTLHHDGATSPPANCPSSCLPVPESSRSSSSAEADRRNHIFGTPTSQTDTPGDGDDMDSVDSVRDVGMDPVRDECGSRIRSFARSVRSVKSLQRHDWDEGAGTPTTLPGRNRPPSSQASSLSVEMFVPPSSGRALDGNRFRNDLLQPKKAAISLQWIKKVGGKTDTERGDHRSHGTGSAKGKQPAQTARRSKKPLRTATVLLSEAVEASPKASGSIQQSGTRRPPPNANDPPPPASSLLSPVDSALVSSSSSSGRRSRMRQLSMEVNRLVTAVTPTRRSISNSTSFGSPTPPARSQSAPLRNALWELEFLPSEATVVKTPREYPVYSPQRLGGKVMPRAKEMKYFSRADMVQSQPPLASVGEHYTQLDPKEQPVVSSEPCLSLIGHVTRADYHAIAPFVEQDRLCKDANTPPGFAGAKAAIHQGFRRASMQAKSMLHRKHPTAVWPLTESDLAEQPPSRLGAAFQWVRRTSASAGTAITDAAFSSRAMRRGQGPSDIEVARPAEVVIAEKKRKKRDSGVIGLYPADDCAESTDSSLTYASALRDIAGLGKHPAGRKKCARAGDRGTSSNVGILITPVPPHYPTNTVHPGALL